MVKMGEVNGKFDHVSFSIITLQNNSYFSQRFLVQANL